ncbi:hypothetical protein [Rhodohalobacter mucosus]|uniref:Uncharacterized protein n=1 Tax=Rhodohalobacter mucosus TaxID=2079485 RepID=A0A316TSE6_9BACT|nr:hypothetical protein [Rhodohalobacter mucosus]PWN07497.1 hypothetical protein DDZ15_04340 [Rhodohalobacter mucosus]
MTTRGYIRACLVLITVSVFLTGCSQNNNQDASLRKAGGIGLSESSLVLNNPVIIYLSEEDILTENRFLHSVNWELRQPRDYSVARVTTTALSQALYVDIFYSCGQLSDNKRLEPDEDFITDYVEWPCSDVMETRMEAVTGDTIAVYEFEIDIPFLNTLSD